MAVRVTGGCRTERCVQLWGWGGGGTVGGGGGCWGAGGGGFWVGQLKNSKPAPQILCTKSIPIPFLTITTNFLTRLGSIKRTCWFISWFYIENIFVYILLAFVKTFFLISAIVFEIFDGIK